MGMAEPLPRHWGGPPELPQAKVSAPVAVMATEAALEDYRLRRRAERVRRTLHPGLVALPPVVSGWFFCPDVWRPIFNTSKLS